MTAENPDGERPELDAAMSRLEGMLHNLSPPVQSSMSPPLPDRSDGEAVDEIIGSLTQMAGASVEDIERLIDDLQTVRERLKTEGARIQQEIADYMRLSGAALDATKIIADSLAKWRNDSIARSVG